MDYSRYTTPAADMLLPKVNVNSLWLLRSVLCFSVVGKPQMWQNPPPNHPKSMYVGAGGVTRIKHEKKYCPKRSKIAFLLGSATYGRLRSEMCRNSKKSQNRLKSSKKTQKCVVSGQIPLITTIIFCVKK